MLLKLARLSLSVDAPTVMADAALQGDMVQLSPPLLPARSAGGRSTGQRTSDDTSCVANQLPGDHCYAIA